jgi:hypothetical protein
VFSSSYIDLHITVEVDVTSKHEHQPARNVEVLSASGISNDLSFIYGVPQVLYLPGTCTYQVPVPYLDGAINKPTQPFETIESSLANASYSSVRYLTVPIFKHNSH